MKSMFFFFFFLIAFKNIFAQECFPSKDNCHTYLCFEMQKECGFQSYPIHYGYKYCSKFKNFEQNFSSQGVLWSQRTRQCLQEGLLTLWDVQCSEVKNQAFGQHAKCYYDAGFCDLKLNDKIQIIRLIKKELINPKLYSQIIQVSGMCFDAEIIYQELQKAL